MGSIKSARRDERGATLVLMALTVFLALGMSALAIDYGMIKSAKAEAQRAMDAAALAGASAFINSDPDFNYDSAAQYRAKEFAAKHTVHSVAVDTNVPPTGNLTVNVDLDAHEVTATYTGHGIPLWFANIFGTSTMAVNALATAHVEESGVATCVKPVAIPDIWNNAPNLVAPKKGAPAESEDLNGNHLFDYKDINNNGYWDDGETEPRKFTPGADTYDSASTGYGTAFRDSYGTGDQVKVKDYGRQMILMTLGPKDNVVSSMYYAWGNDATVTNSDSLAARIRGTNCSPVELQTEYRAANGGHTGPVQAAWEDLINSDAGAAWDEHTNTVTGSDYHGNWMDASPRAIVVGLYDPSLYANTPSANSIKFINLAKVWVDQRPPCAGQGAGNCKQPITGRFLGFLGGGPSGETTGTLVKRLVLIK